MKLDIPVEQHVYQFFTSPEMYGAELPIKARKDTLLGMLLIMIAKKGPFDMDDFYASRFVPDMPASDKLAKLSIDTSFPMRKEFIDESNLLYIGELLGNMFEMFIIFYSMGYTARAGSERGAIARVYEQFMIDDDPIKQESLRAICKRYRHKVRENYKRADAKKTSHSVKKASQYA